MSAPQFACLVPGRAMITDFVQLDAKKMQCVLPQPNQITQFAISQLRPELPLDCGVGIFYASADGNWSYLGKVNMQCPTQFFKAPWSSGDPSLATPTATVQIGLMLESEAVLKDMVPADQILETRTVDNVKGIAHDLYKFLTSFAGDPHSIPRGTDCLVVPGNVMDRWLAKFEDRHKRHPFFWMEQKRE